jgi:hypothetical protein
MKALATILFSSLILLTGCNRYYYAPNKTNIPSLRAKNDMRIEGGVGSGVMMEGADLQASYAAGKNIGIMVNGAVNQNQSGTGEFSENDRTRSVFYEAGIGYFKEFNENPNWLFEIYGGMGRGIYYIENASVKLPQINQNRFFAQPSLTYTHPSKNIEFGIASRMAVVSYLHTPFAFNTAGSFEQELNELGRYPNKFLWEPSFRFSGGFDIVKFYVSYTPSLSPSRDFEYRDFMNLGLGVRLTFNTKKTSP